MSGFEFQLQKKLKLLS